MRKVLAAALMLALSASLLLISGTAAKNYMNNNTTGQIDYHSTKASGVTTITNGDQPSQTTSMLRKTDLNHALLTIYPNGNQSETVFTNISVVPNNVIVSVNQTFSVDVWINNVSDMAGWEISLLWNNSVLKCVQAQVNTPLEWGGVAFDWFNKTASDVNEIGINAVYTAWLFGSGIDNNVSATYGLYGKAECYGPYRSGCDNTFNGSLAIVTLTFQALNAGSTSLDLEECRARRTVEDEWTYHWNIIGDANAKLIASVENSGFVEVQG
jgi:hypothetical protein